MVLLLSCGAPVVGTISDFKDVTAGVQSIVTVLALIVGAAFAWYKWIRSSPQWTFFPRVELAMRGTRVHLGNQDGVICTVSVKNVGNEPARVLQRGTGISVDRGRIDPEGAVVWEEGLVETVRFGDTDISPQDFANDELLVVLGEPTHLFRVQTRVVWSWAGRDSGNFQETVILILPPLAPSPPTGSVGVEAVP